MKGVLPLEKQSKRRLQAVAKQLSRHRDDIVSDWTSAYLTSPVREARLTDDQAMAMIRRLVDLFLDDVSQGHFEDYYRDLAAAGQEFSLLGTSYTNLVLAVHLYEEVIDPFVADIYHDPQEFLELILDLDHFNHNTLAILASSFFDVLIKELEKRAEETAEANRKREEFITLVAHEFRGPLTVIIGQGELLGLVEPTNTSPAHKAANAIVSQGKRLARLVDDLQDVSQIETGHFRIRRERFDVVQLAQEILTAQQATTENHQLTLRAPSRPLEVDWDRDRISQVLINLLSNAIKYSAGGIVTLEVQPCDGEVQITVSDRGAGITPEDISRLFRPYTRLDHAQNIKGTGVGLFISKGIVQAHDGDIQVESEVGKGTTFRVTIPAQGS